MSILNAWWEEFSGRVAGQDDKSMQRKVWNFSWPTLLVITLLLFVAWAGLATAPEIQENLPSGMKWLPRIMPIAPYVLIASLMFFVWHGAISFHKASGPIIWIDNSMCGHEYQKGYFNFEIRVQNVGRDEVDAFIYIVELCDASGKRIPATETEKRRLIRLKRT